MNGSLKDSVSRCCPLGYSSNPFFSCKKRLNLPCLTNTLFLGDKPLGLEYLDKSGLGNDIPIVDSNCKEFNGTDSKITIWDAYLGLMSSYSIEYSLDSGTSFQTWTSGDASIIGLTQRPTVYHVDIGFDGTNYIAALIGNISFYDSFGVKKVEFTNAEGLDFSINRLNIKNLISGDKNLTLDNKNLIQEI